MSAVDFAAWAAPDLVLTLGGRTYRVSPPSVEDAAKILALAVVAEVKIGLAVGDIPVEVQRIVDGIKPTEHPALREARQQMIDDGHLPMTIDRASVYAIFFWARGPAYADFAATLMWTERQEPDEGGAVPKG